MNKWRETCEKPICILLFAHTDSPGRATAGFSQDSEFVRMSAPQPTPILRGLCDAQMASSTAPMSVTNGFAGLFLALNTFGKRA